MSLSTKTYEDVFLEEVETEHPDTTAIDAVLGKQWARISTSADDDIVDILRQACQTAFERYTNSTLFETTVTALFSASAGNIQFQLPYKPFESIVHIRTGEGELTEDDDLDASDYKRKGNWITIDNFDDELIEVKYISKRYDSPSDVDKMIKLGLLKFIASNYNDREDVAAITVSEMPNDSKSMWKPFRYMRL